jgi:hypothetical protein
MKIRGRSKKQEGLLDVKLFSFLPTRGMERPLKGINSERLSSGRPGIHWA